jgi:N utilization substance protein A
MKKGYDSLLQLPEISISLADALFERGFFSAEEISIASVEDLMQIRDMTEEQALELIGAANELAIKAETGMNSKDKSPDEPTDEIDDIDDIEEAAQKEETDAPEMDSEVDEE